jgi:hypothetical protein
MTDELELELELETKVELEAKVEVEAEGASGGLAAVSVEVPLLGSGPHRLLSFTEGDSCKLVEHAIRSQHNIRGGALAKDGKVYLGSTLFLPGVYVFMGGKVCQNPGEGWAKKKGAKCPCC